MHRDEQVLGESSMQRKHPQGERILGAGPSAAAADEFAPVALPARVGWQAAIAATVSGLGYELVDVERAQRGLLRISIDRIPGRSYTYRHGDVVDSGEFVTVEDCEAVTRQLQYVLEVEALDYARLEVSSPGLDRPLKREEDFTRFAGQAVHVTLKVAFQGRKVWQGLLSVGAAGGWSLLIKEGKTEQQLNFTFDEVREAKLVPAVDFKGRKPKAVAPVGDGGVAPVAPKDDGDRNR